jgi:hypothetical protein
MFTNFFVADNEVPKEFSGCFNINGPSPSTRGTLTGSWISGSLGPATNIIPVPHNSIKGLYLFAAHRGSLTKMVGMQYGSGSPTRVDGRGYEEVVPLTSSSLSNAWNKAQYQNVTSSEYDLSIYEESPSSTIENCKNQAVANGASVFSVSNMTKNGLVQCGTGSNLGSQINGATEQQCLNNKKAITEYKVTPEQVTGTAITNLPQLCGLPTGSIIEYKGVICNGDTGAVEWKSMKNLDPLPGLKPSQCQWQRKNDSSSENILWNDSYLGNCGIPPLLVPDLETTSQGLNNLGKTFGGKKDSSGKMIYKEYPESMLSMGTEYNHIPNYNSFEFTLTDGLIENVNAEECKQYCVNRGEDCKGFVFEKDSNTCNLKESIYPEVPKLPDNNSDIYTRIPVLTNTNNGSCTTKVEAVSGELLNENGLISNDMMPTNLPCSLEEDVQKEQNKMNTSYNMELESVQDLQATNQRIVKELEQARKSVTEKTHQFKKNFKRSKKIMDNPTPTVQMEDAFELQKSRSMKYIFLLLGILGLSIVLIRVLRK